MGNCLLCEESEISLRHSSFNNNTNAQTANHFTIPEKEAKSLLQPNKIKDSSNTEPTGKILELHSECGSIIKISITLEQKDEDNKADVSEKLQLISKISSSQAAVIPGKYLEYMCCEKLIFSDFSVWNIESLQKLDNLISEFHSHLIKNHNIKLGDYFSEKNNCDLLNSKKFTLGYLVHIYICKIEFYLNNMRKAQVNEGKYLQFRDELDSIFYKCPLKKIIDFFDQSNLIIPDLHLIYYSVI